MNISGIFTVKKAKWDPENLKSVNRSGIFTVKKAKWGLKKLKASCNCNPVFTELKSESKVNIKACNQLAFSN